MEQDRLALGRAIRREVLGDAYVEAADKDLNQDDFLRPFRELTAEFLWGSIWSRPGLDRKTRVLLNIAILTALGKTEELKLYLGEPLQRAGISQEEAREVLLHCSLYCGIPAAVHAFKAAKEAMAPPAA